MNEPPSVDVEGLFLLWEACYNAIRAVSPDIAVGVMHPGQIPRPDAGLSPRNVAWLRSLQLSSSSSPSSSSSSTGEKVAGGGGGGGGGLFYAIHWYGSDEDGSVEHAIGDALRFAAPYKMPTLLTEYDPHDCDTMRAASYLGVGSAWWHYANCEQQIHYSYPHTRHAHASCFDGGCYVCCCWCCCCVVVGVSL